MSRTSLKMLCSKIDTLEVVNVFESGLESIDWLKNSDVDLIFLDIEMPDLSGLDLVKSIDNLPQIVFITSHSEYAVDAFEHQVTDFIPKPVQLPRLIKAVDRAKELNENVKKEEQNEIYVRVDGRFIRLPLNNVSYIESLGDYVTFVTDQKRYIVHSTLKNIDEKITNDNFLKVHRSYIINLSKIVDIEETNLVIGDKVIPISRAHKPILMERIKPI